MHCPKCGTKINQKANFCIRCGRAVSKILVQHTQWLAPILGSALLLGTIGLGVLIYQNKQLLKIKPFFTPGKEAAEEITEETSTIIIPTPEIITDYPVMKGIETKYWDRALPKATAWSDKAKLCYFSVAVSDLETLTPRVHYSFCSPDEEKIFNYRRSSVRVEKTSTTANRFSYESSITPFPPLVTAEEAVDLAIKNFNQNKTDNQEVTGFSISLKTQEDYWRVSLTVKITLDTQDQTNDQDQTKTKTDFATCSIYFDRQIFCEELIPPPETMAELLELVAGIETRDLAIAQQAAQEWSSQAKLRRFYLSFSNLSDTDPNVSYSFYADDQDNLFDFSWYNRHKKPDLEIEALQKYQHKIALSNFPPPLSAKEAISIVLADFEKNHPANQDLHSFGADVEENDTAWNVRLTIKITNPGPDEAKYQYPRYQVNFDNKELTYIE